MNSVDEYIAEFPKEIQTVLGIVKLVAELRINDKNGYYF
ncbi:hypothetical protein EZS27_014227 [termite gut metagenome]|uniref:Uncharacterized protein n=1 Tax=termite gut metagenome TaxID=433724 RepID=A0A5J4RUP4_9ZZZZ